MIYLKTLLNVIDNSGASLVECVNVFGKGNKSAGRVGDKIVVVVQQLRNARLLSQNSANRVQRGDIRHAVIVRTKKEFSRPDGTVVRFDDNACVLVNNQGEPVGTRVMGVVARELQTKYSKIVSLAPKVI
ncbi:mitochondrial 54S ribosomal protein uL14m [Kockiozyma suomiensis]|uniref:mitochondrial 54S ribosomal protein uL14m n=1 Tax=Kockiozyma suomiensis TaxID=1337062 RepID=UPI0033433E69